MTEVDKRLLTHQGSILDTARYYGSYEVRVNGSLANREGTSDNNNDILIESYHQIELIVLLRL